MRFSEYELALASLVAIPAQLRAGMVAADRADEAAEAAAEAALQGATSRLNRLRHSAQSRYSDAAASATAQGIRLPAQVRGEAVSSIDDDLLRRAIDEQTSAIAAFAAALRETSRTAAHEQVDASRRTAEAQQAALALKARQERIRLERAAEAEAEAEERAAASRRRRRRVVAIASVIASVAVIAGVIVVILLIRP